MPWVQLRPSEIYFLHDSIDCRFRDGRSLLDTLDELLSRKISVSDIQRIAVFYWDEKHNWHIYAGNRRLYLYKILEALGIVEKIDVWKVWKVHWDAVDKKNTTLNGGTSVEIRNDHNFDVRLREVIKRHTGYSYFKGTAKVSDKDKWVGNIEKRNSLSASEKGDLESIGSDEEYGAERGQESEKDDLESINSDVKYGVERGQESAKDDLKSIGSDVENGVDSSQESSGDAVESDAKYVRELTSSVVMYDGRSGPESSVQVTHQSQITPRDNSDSSGTGKTSCCRCTIL
ncbi:uncharacterized protein [Ptychodera flava]|uniref:uncharacterized protein n=1 Tax=Ptychodera flava TaxID=63121 RepID=UPI003969CB57